MFGNATTGSRAASPTRSSAATTSSRRRSAPYVTPWLDAELEETEALMGADFHPYGFDKNRDTIDIFCRQAYELGVVGRMVTAEEYFAEFLAS